MATESSLKKGTKASKSKKKTDKKKRNFTPPPPEKIDKIIAILGETHPDAKVALRFNNPLEILVATILSAQCTDERVNKVTKTLFNRYRTAQDYAEADMDELRDIIRSTGFFNQKSKYIVEMAKGLVAKFNGKVPDNMDDLITLPGVARKTANVVLSAAFGKSEGIVVDTHVKRVSFRLGLTDQTNPEKIEKDLMKIIPKDKWIFMGIALIFHGRRFCKARKPLCDDCSLSELCPSAFSF
ncbi:MAG: endonuclease III [Candidatus Eremiobacteraeota bacterium]|nr:endonuclease III [Candidatus Eremiobacteraeota bacterium]